MAGGHAAEHALDLTALVGGALEIARERFDRQPRGFEQHADLAVALLGMGVQGLVAGAAALDFMQPVPKRLDQRAAALGMFEQIVLQIRIALHDPDVAQHFVQHARAAAGAAFGA